MRKLLASVGCVLQEIFLLKKPFEALTPICGIIWLKIRLIASARDDSQSKEGVSMKEINVWPEEMVPV